MASWKLKNYLDPLKLWSDPDVPETPNFKSAAVEEAEGNLNLARYQTRANRFNETDPFGSKIWTQDPNNPDLWSSETRLSPGQQNIYDQSQAMDLQMATMGNAAANQLEDVFGSRFRTDPTAPDYQGPSSPLEEYGTRRQSVMDAMLSRVNTDNARDRDSVASNLVARGIPQGSEAWNTEMERLDRQMTDARQQAEINATGMAGQEYDSMLQGRDMGNQEAMSQYATGLQSHQQRVSDMLLERQTPLNELNAFRTGSQIQNPQFSAPGMMSLVAGPDFTGAMQQTYGGAMDRFNAQQADINSKRKLAGSVVSAGATFMSDIRLKHNIKRVGAYHGFPEYEFSYIGSNDRYIGVMAQDVIKVKPEAVIEIDGYYAVNYGAI